MRLSTALISRGPKGDTGATGATGATGPAGADGILTADGTTELPLATRDNLALQWPEAVTVIPGPFDSHAEAGVGGVIVGGLYYTSLGEVKVRMVVPLDADVVSHYEKFVSDIPLETNKANFSSFITSLKAKDYYSDITQLTLYGHRYNDDSTTQYAFIGDDQTSANITPTFDGARFVDNTLVDVADTNAAGAVTFVVWGTALNESTGASSFISRLHVSGNIQDNVIMLYQGSDNEFRGLQQEDTSFVHQVVIGYNAGGPAFDTRSPQAKVLAMTIDQAGAGSLQLFADGIPNTEIDRSGDDPLNAVVNRLAMYDTFEFGGMLVIEHKLTPAEHVELNSLIRNTVYKYGPIRTIYEGDSRIATGTPAPHWGDRAKLLGTVSTLGIGDVNTATGGDTPADVLADMATQLDALTIYGDPGANRMLLCAGINGSADNVETAAQQYETLVSISTLARSYGLFVEICTIPKHGAGDSAGAVNAYPGALNDLLDEINTLIRAGVPTDFDALVDLDAGFKAAELTLPNPSNRNYYDPNWGNAADVTADPTTLPFYSDTVHFVTENGQEIAGQIYAASRRLSQE